MSSIKQLILASGSPYRRTLLAATGLIFASEVAPVDEAAIGGATPREIAERRAVAKALAVAALRVEALVIGADQVLSFGGQSFDKAASAAAAAVRLRSLAGRTHYLHAGMALAFARPGSAPRVLIAEVVDVPMRMRPLSSAEIDAYVRTGEWEGSVGCYQYENRGAHLFTATDEPGPDLATVVGLPIGRLLEHLRRLGVNGLLRPGPPWALTTGLADVSP